MPDTKSCPVHQELDSPMQSVSREVLLERYARAGEQSIDAVNQRVPHALAQAEFAAERSAWEERFMHTLEAGFLPAGRIQSAAGCGLAATLVNCFVQPEPASRARTCMPQGWITARSVLAPSTAASAAAASSAGAAP